MNGPRRKGGKKEWDGCNAKKQVNGYMTLEMALIFPMVFALVIMILYTAFFLYDKCRMTQDLYREAYRQSVVRGKAAPPLEVDTSSYLLMRGCNCTCSVGSEICAEASGQIAPALVTGMGTPVWELKVTMKARKTDPPLAFRRYRRVMAIAGQVRTKKE